MKFVLAPDSFKESMTSIEACNAMERGIKKVIKEAECIKVPMADGGEGTVEALVYATSGKVEKAVVTGPLGDKVEAFYGILGNKTTAVIEMASASGIQLIKKEKRNPLITTTFGTGELIKIILDRGIKHIVIGIGGSATNDGGSGMLQALGAKILDNNKNQIGFGGRELKNIRSIDLSSLDKRIKDVKIEVACDVNNPLIGEKGASKIFAPQKGADSLMVSELENNLRYYSSIIKRDLGKDIAYIEGAGAAGGLGAALILIGGELKKGVGLVIEHTELDKKIKGADFLFTGEGSIDNQTIFGKTPSGVSILAKENKVPVIAFSGKVGVGYESLYKIGIDSIFSIVNGALSLEEALKRGVENLEITTENVVRLLKLKSRI